MKKTSFVFNHKKYLTYVFNQLLDGNKNWKYTIGTAYLNTDECEENKSNSCSTTNYCNKSTTSV